MTDIRRTILWVIFGFSLVMLWDQWQVYNGKQATFFPSGKPAVTAPAPAGGAARPRPCRARQACPAPAPPPRPRRPAARGHDRQHRGRAARAHHGHHRRAASPSTAKAALVHTEFPKLAGEKPGVPYVLLDQSADRVYVAQNRPDRRRLPDAQDADDGRAGERTLKDGANELTVRFESPVQGGLKLVKTYTSSAAPTTVGVKHEW